MQNAERFTYGSDIRQTTSERSRHVQSQLHPVRSRLQTSSQPDQSHALRMRPKPTIHVSVLRFAHQAEGKLQETYGQAASGADVSRRHVRL